ncbi:hypothetical protein [Dysgonomonas termitidis]|uniref:Uncharacterized protein n=1 Tax=Dysgonomonas termitidis TaxID=1516126 RepID=A0ABV9L1X1_9BACT
MKKHENREDALKELLAALGIMLLIFLMFYTCSGHEPSYRLHVY